MRRRGAGFTLLEVLVALVVIGIGLGAALRLLTSTEEGLRQREQRMVAGWVAENLLNSVRLGDGTSRLTGTVRMAGREWRWRLRPEAAEAGGMHRLQVTVAAAQRPEAVLIDLRALL